MVITKGEGTTSGKGGSNVLQQKGAAPNKCPEYGRGVHLAFDQKAKKEGAYVWRGEENRLNIKNRG